MRLIYLLAALFATFWTAPAAAQAPLYFYCYAVDAKAGAVYLSDTHKVGPVAERRTYGQAFSAYLTEQGKVPAGTPAYCVMRGNEQAIERAQMDLAIQGCPECAGATRFGQVAWPRNGETGKMLAALPQNDRAGQASPVGSSELALGQGVHIMVREDSADMLVSANEANGLTTIRQQALQKGGKWEFLTQDDRCVGWMAVSYATDGKTPHYFLARGFESAEEANLTARNMADTWKETQQGTWITGRLDMFRNDYRPDTSGSRPAGVIDYAKAMAHRMLVKGAKGCEGPAKRGATIGGPRG